MQWQKEYLIRKNVAINKRHLASFHHVYGIKQYTNIHLIYPLVLVHPYLMRIMCSSEIPISILKFLNTSNSIKMYRKMFSYERFDINIHNCDIRKTPRGYEIDFKSIVISSGDVVWECVSKFSSVENSFGNENSASFSKSNFAKHEIIKKWYLPATNRFKFAFKFDAMNIIYDIHYYRWLWRYKRDFVDPLSVVAQCVSFLPKKNSFVLRSWLEEVIDNCTNVRFN